MRVAQFLLKIAQLAREPRGLGAWDFYSDYGSVQISKKQTVVGNAYFKDFFLALPILSLIINSIIVLSLMCWKSKMVKLRN